MDTAIFDLNSRLELEFCIRGFLITTTQTDKRIHAHLLFPYIFEDNDT